MGDLCDRAQWPEVPAQDYSSAHNRRERSRRREANSRFEDLGFKVVMLDEPPPPSPSTDGPDEEAIETALSLEYDLENSLVTNLEQLENGLKLAVQH